MEFFVRLQHGSWNRSRGYSKRSAFVVIIHNVDGSSFEWIAKNRAGRWSKNLAVCFFLSPCEVHCGMKRSSVFLLSDYYLAGTARVTHTRCRGSWWILMANRLSSIQNWIFDKTAASIWQRLLNNDSNSEATDIFSQISILNLFKNSFGKVKRQARRHYLADFSV